MLFSVEKSLTMKTAKYQLKSTCILTQSSKLNMPAFQNYLQRPLSVHAFMNAMEHARNWMWARRKLSGRSHVLATRSSYNDSWEEQAFAEDSSGALGGCIWPPRSYSCSFCRREFRSAQALGGHMNVHRRDRARLKQSPNDKESPCTQLGIEYPPQVCTMVCNPNSNPNPNIVTSPLSPSRVSTPCIQGNSHEVLVSQSFSPSFLQQNQKCSFFSPHHTDSVRSLDILDLKLERENTRLSEMGCQLKRIKPDSAISTLDLVGHQSQEEDSVSDEEEISAKRRRIDKSLPLFCKSEVGKRRVDTSLPFFVKPSPRDRHQLQSEVHGLSCSPMDDLDLELRLGDRPNIK